MILLSLEGLPGCGTEISKVLHRQEVTAQCSIHVHYLQPRNTDGDPEQESLYHLLQCVEAVQRFNTYDKVVLCLGPWLDPGSFNPRFRALREDLLDALVRRLGLAVHLHVQVYLRCSIHECYERIRSDGVECPLASTVNLHTLQRMQDTLDAQFGEELVSKTFSCARYLLELPAHAEDNAFEVARVGACLAAVVRSHLGEAAPVTASQIAEPPPPTEEWVKVSQEEDEKEKEEERIKDPIFRPLPNVGLKRYYRPGLVTTYSPHSHPLSHLPLSASIAFSAALCAPRVVSPGSQSQQTQTQWTLGLHAPFPCVGPLSRGPLPLLGVGPLPRRTPTAAN